MSVYVSFFTYERDSWRAMVETPENRSEAARKLIEAVGGRLEAFYWMLGEHDGMIIYSVPDSETAAAVSAAIASSGRIARRQTSPLLTSDEALRVLERARTLQSSYEPPGGAREWRVDYSEGVGIA